MPLLFPCTHLRIYRNPEKVSKIVSTLNLNIAPRDLKTKDTRHLLALIFGQWLSLSKSTIQAVIDVIPPPSLAQSTRIPKMLYPDLSAEKIEPKNRLERNLYNCDSSPKACVIAYVSKMFAVLRKDLPENKRRPLTAQEMRERGRDLRQAREIAGIETQSAVPKQPESDSGVNGNGSLEEEERETALLGFARLYSGVLRKSSVLYCILPKYNDALGPTHPRNANHIVKAKMEELYVMMGRDLEPVDVVRAGNVFAVKGLEGKVWRNATLCATSADAGTSDDPNLDRDALINLGGVTRQVGTMCLSAFHFDA